MKDVAMKDDERCSNESLPVVDMKQRLVAHEEGPHQLQCGNLKREVEGGDQPHRAKRPPVPVALLTSMVS